MIERKEGPIFFRASSWPLNGEKPVVVFIHGAGGSSLMWKAQLEGLGKDLDCIAIDLPGHGGSGGPAFTNVGDYAGAVAGFIGALGLEGPLLAGLSMGGAITQTLMLDSPGRFKKAALISTGARLKVLPAIFSVLENDFPAYLAMLGKVSASAKTDPAVLEEFIADTAKRDPMTIHGDFKACDDFDARERLPGLKADVLVISAEDDQLTPPKYGDYLAANIGGARLVRIADAGHMVPIEKPAEVNRAIMEFLSGPA